jgi:hypothetical protein
VVVTVDPPSLDIAAHHVDPATFRSERQVSNFRIVRERPATVAAVEGIAVLGWHVEVVDEQ